MAQPNTQTKPVMMQAKYPVVLAEPKKKKKKRRFSQGLRTIQDVERGVTVSLRTVSAGVARVLSEYTERSEKSSRKKRDGALRDAIENWTKAMSKGMRMGGKAPYDFVKAVNSEGGSKPLRDTIKLLTPPPLR
jgi:hypothetical protein